MSAAIAESFDAIVIGSGQGGNPLAGALVAAGKKTALIERQDVGGTCINRGCTPTKTMVASARAAYTSAPGRRLRCPSRPRHRRHGSGAREKTRHRPQLSRGQ